MRWRAPGELDGPEQLADFVAATSLLAELLALILTCHHALLLAGDGGPATDGLALAASFAACLARLLRHPPGAPGRGHPGYAAASYGLLGPPVLREACSAWRAATVLLLEGTR